MEDKLIKKYIPMTETAFLILFSLQSAKHGYAIMETVRKLTHERVTLGNGTLYGTLSRMEKDKLITIISTAEARKIYELTTLGSEILELEIKRLEQMNFLIKESRGRK